jgi:peptidoglycan/LPS O-acetylase OafA/YrhL
MPAGNSQITPLRPAIFSLTGLRFFAAAFILIGHSIPFLLPFPSGSPDWHTYLRSLALLGMPLFFVLSGFVIQYNYSAAIERDRQRGIINFFVARFSRLYPLFFACLVFDLTFRYFYKQLPDATSQALPYYLTLTQSWLYVPMGEHTIIFLFGVMPQVSWSISTEWFFYCLYPLVYLLLRYLQTTRQILTTILVVVLVSLATITTLGLLRPSINAAALEAFGPIAIGRTFESFYFWLLYFSPYLRIPEFLIGCLCAALFLKMRERLPSLIEQRIALLATIGAIIGIGSLLWFYGVHFRALEAPVDLSGMDSVLTSFAYCFGFAPFVAVIIFCCARYKNQIVSFLSEPKFVLCGEASYSLYMLHLMVIYAFRFTVSPVMSTEVGIANAMMWALTLACAIGLSIVSWSCLEVPARRSLRRAFLKN